MKRKVVWVFVLALSLALVSCSTVESKEITLTCDEVVKAYENAGYVVYHNHNYDPEMFDNWCHMTIEDPQKPDTNYLYIDRYHTEEKAKEMAEETEYHPVLWFMAGVFGEWRWLKTGYYGDIQYSTYYGKMIEPLEKLMR